MAAYRAVTWLRHALTAWNTGGEGVHSPHLFELVRMILRDRNRYYSWRGIEDRRVAMLHWDKALEVRDYGTGGGRGDVEVRRVCDIARGSLERPAVGQALFRLTAWLGRKGNRPLDVLELGTSLGITTAYLAAPDSRNRVVTLEGSESIAAVARGNWEKLGLGNIRCVTGNIDETLAPLVAEYKAEGRGVDVLWLDANHTYEAVLRYFRELLALRGEMSVFAVDDIHHSREMEEAWHVIQEMEEVTTTIDYYHFGLVFFDPHFLRKHYRMWL